MRTIQMTLDEDLVDTIDRFLLGFWSVHLSQVQGRTDHGEQKAFGGETP